MGGLDSVIDNAEWHGWALRADRNADGGRGDKRGDEPRQPPPGVSKKLHSHCVDRFPRDLNRRDRGSVRRARWAPFPNTSDEPVGETHAPLRPPHAMRASSVVSVCITAAAHRAKRTESLNPISRRRIAPDPRLDSIPEIMADMSMGRE